MKLLYLFLLLVFSFVSVGQSDSIYHIASERHIDTTKKVINHGVYAEFLGVGGHGSIGYNLILKTAPKFKTNIYAGVGAIFSRNNTPSAALIVPFGISEEFKILNSLSIEIGAFVSLYFNYIGTFTNEIKDCSRLSYCPPDNDFFFAGFLGLNYQYNQLFICPRLNMHAPNFWSSDIEFMPSLALKFSL